MKPFDLRIGIIALCAMLFALAAIAAPADDGMNAGSRSWVLNQGRSFVAVTPSDGADLAIAPTRGIIVAGSAACVLAIRGADDGTTTTNVTVAPGVAHPFQIKRVMATNTTCTGIVAIY